MRRYTRTTKKEKYRLFHEVLKPLYELGYSTDKASTIAGIPPSTVRGWLNKDPVMCGKIETWKNSTSMKARKNWISSIEKGNIKDSKEWLEKIDREDFGNISSPQNNARPVKVEFTIFDPLEKPAKKKIIDGNIKKIK